MVWDPANLQLKSVDSGEITDADLDVTITINGAGFDTGPNMFGVFVKSGQAPAREATIPCNNIQTTEGNFQATAAICPRKKLPGSYDLIWWLARPGDLDVPGEDGAASTKAKVNVPVNDIAVLPNAITIKKKLT